MKKRSNNSDVYVLSMLEKLEIIQQYALNLDTATIYLAGEVDGNLSTALRLKYDMLKIYWADELKKPLNTITLIINSIGGDASTIASVRDFYEEILKKDKVVVDVHAESVCMSAATFIVAGATGVRRASKRTRFMVHEMQIEGVGGTATQTKACNVEIERMQRECYELYAHFQHARDPQKPSKVSMQKTIKQWENLCEKETYLSAVEAKKLGIIDEIV